MNTIVPKIWKVAKYILFLLVAVIFLLEILLRIYDPFEFRQRGNEVILPRNRTMIFDNDNIPSLDKKIVHTKNSLGFRGAEPPSDFHRHTSIIAVGGSTTECFYLSDSICWTNLLQKNLSADIDKLWINNAGFQGHSTFGNFVLINDYLKYLKPKYILLLTGMNDVNRTDIRTDESIAVRSRNTSVWGWLKRNSRVLNLVINIQRFLMADRMGVTDNYFDPARAEVLNLSSRYIDSAIAEQRSLVDAYARRLGEIIDTCVSNKIEPILITQPSLFGGGVDCVSGVDLATIKNSEGYNGELFWKLLEMYNAETRLLAKERGLHLVDLAREMPKCSRYFYDVCHFTNAGSEKVSEIVGESLRDYLR